MQIVVNCTVGTIDAVCGDAPMAREAHVYDNQAAWDFHNQECCKHFANDRMARKCS